jgi:hypothetical protein
MGAGGFHIPRRVFVLSFFKALLGIKTLIKYRGVKNVYIL